MSPSESCNRTAQSPGDMQHRRCDSASVLNEDTTQTDQLRSLSARPPSGNPHTERQSGTIDNINTVTGSLRASADWGSNADDDVLQVATTKSIGYQSNTTPDAGRQMFFSESKNTSENERGNIQATKVRYDSRGIDESTSIEPIDPTPPKHLSLGRSESSFANPTKASPACQTERSQTPSLIDLPCKPAGSPSLIRLGNVHDSTGPVSLSRANSQIVQRLDRSVSPPSRSPESVRETSLTSEHNVPDDDTVSEIGEHSDWGPVASEFGTNSANLSYELGNPLRSVHLPNMDIHDFYGDSGEPDYEYLVKENQCLHHELYLADRDRGRCHAELHDLTSDINHLCNAWSKVCAAAQVSCDAVNNFHFLVTDAEVDPDSRVAAHQELKVNELYRCIIALRDAVNNFELEDTAAQNESMNWWDLYEKEQERFKALKDQYKSFRCDAERAYQPDLEQKHRECQTDLTKAQDHIAILKDAVEQAKEEALSWEDKAMKLEDQLARREAQHDDSASKVNDSSRWDKNGIEKFEKLEGGQAVLAKEWEHVKRSNTDNSNELKKLFQRHQEHQLEVLSSRLTMPIKKAVAGKRIERDLAQKGVEELRERLRKQREEEDAEDALKDKVRQLRLQDLRSTAESKMKDFVGQGWFTRWRGSEYLDKLTEEEREISNRL